MRKADILASARDAERALRLMETALAPGITSFDDRVIVLLLERARERFHYPQKQVRIEVSRNGNGS